jgi:geranylgeranyl diphosphate synthase type II
MSTTTTPSPTALLETGRSRIETAMARLSRVWLRGVSPRVADPIRYALAGGGKRLRPLLCVRTHSALAGGESPDAVYDAACAIEWIHTYSLIHDDLPCMDDDDLRRGRPAAHRVFGAEPAAVAGAAMIPLSFALLERACLEAGLGPGPRSETVRELARAAGSAGMVGGQVLDLAAESRAVGLAELEGIHGMKTGALFSASFRIGGRLAGAGPPVLAALGRAGAALGLAFQVTDDLLDETGTTAVLGKKAGSDRVLHKATYPALLSLEAAAAKARAAADAARSALAEAGVSDGPLESLITFAVQRDR